MQAWQKPRSGVELTGKTQVQGRAAILAAQQRGRAQRRDRVRRLVAPWLELAPWLEPVPWLELVHAAAAGTMAAPHLRPLSPASQRYRHAASPEHSVQGCRDGPPALKPGKVGRARSPCGSANGRVRANLQPTRALPKRPGDRQSRPVAERERRARGQARCRRAERADSSAPTCGVHPLPVRWGRPDRQGDWARSGRPAAH